MTRRPDVSVVMAAYNAAVHVGAAASSVLWQEGVDLELVVVDDGSTDATAAIVSALEDGRVRLIQQANAGVAAARNAGMAAAAGRFIAFCDADDVLFPRHLAALLESWRSVGQGPDRGVATANAYWLFPAGIEPRRTRHTGRFPRPEDQRRAILERNFVSTMSLFPRAVVDEVGPMAEDLAVAEDWELWMRMVFAGHAVAHQPRPLALYRWGDDGLSSRPERMDEAVAEVLRRAASRLPLEPPERAYVERRLAAPSPAELARRGEDLLEDGRWREAAQSMRDASALVPSEAELRWKARLLAAAPPLTGPVLRAVQRRRDSRLGRGREHRR